MLLNRLGSLLSIHITDEHERTILHICSILEQARMIIDTHFDK